MNGFIFNPGWDSLPQLPDSACGVCTALVRAGILTQCFFARLLSAKACRPPRRCCPVAVADAQETKVDSSAFTEMPRSQSLCAISVAGKSHGTRPSAKSWTAQEPNLIRDLNFFVLWNIGR
jgi:hypothetical protein